MPQATWTSVTRRRPPRPGTQQRKRTLADSSLFELDGRRIAIVNWRDPWHPDAGGAERYAWEMARRLAGRGAKVCFVTCRATGQRRRDRRGGVELIRMGRRFSVYPLILCWMLMHRRSFDAVADCQNGIPFFTPWVLPRRVPVFCVMHHVHDRQFGVYFPAWMAWVGRLLEGPVARWSYRRHACIAVSLSTEDAMRERLRWTGPVYLIPNGISVAEPPDAATGGLRLAWVGRLVAHKRVLDILDVAARLAGTGATIHVIGRGPDSGRLAQQAVARGLGDAVRMHGYLPEEDKAALVAGSLLHLNTSQGEGWGLCVLEAAALGVPTVAYDVDGLRDAVRDGQTGWLVADGDRIENVAEQAIKELSVPERRADVQAACRRWAACFGWDRSAERFATLLAAAIDRGTARGTREGARLIRCDGVDGSHTIVAEGPVWDVLAEHADGAQELREPTSVERLLGHDVDEAGQRP